MSSPTILVVEDNSTEMLLLKRAWQRAKIPNPLQWVLDGVEAIAYLNGDGKWSNREEYPLPALVLLDLKMPLVSGFDVLRWVRQHPVLHKIRVVMFSSSDEPRDINQAYELGTNSYSVKPLHFEDLVRVVDLLSKHWLNLSRSPDCTVK